MGHSDMKVFGFKKKGNIKLYCSLELYLLLVEAFL